MEIGKTLYMKTRLEWREWLEKNHAKEKEIWLIYYRKDTGKPRISYNDAVEEALCFGWIDSIEKGVDTERFAQRFSPRRKKSNWSPLNIERMKRLIKDRKMTLFGLRYFSKDYTDVKTEKAWRVPDDILLELKTDKKTWEYFQSFSEKYKRIRIGWITGARKRPLEFQKRLRYFLKMTSQNKQFGMVR